MGRPPLVWRTWVCCCCGPRHSIHPPSTFHHPQQRDCAHPRSSLSPLTSGISWTGVRQGTTVKHPHVINRRQSQRMASACKDGQACTRPGHLGIPSNLKNPPEDVQAGAPPLVGPRYARHAVGVCSLVHRSTCPGSYSFLLFLLPPLSPLAWLDLKPVLDMQS
jgi:hypothetical protein